MLSWCFKVRIHAIVLPALQAKSHVSNSVTVILRLPTLVRYSMHLEECMTFMKENGYPNPSDKWLCALVRLQRIMEEASIAFSVSPRILKTSPAPKGEKIHLTKSYV